MCRVLLGLIIAIGLPLRSVPAAPLSPNARNAPYAPSPQALQAPPALEAPPGLSFHHLHLNDPQWPFLLDFYERLFDPSATARFSAGSVDGLRSGSMLMLINRASYARPHASAIWHFGWGTVSLGESYLAHAGREVAWEPPLPPNLLHLHLLSVTPAAAAAWYRDVLGARVEFAVVPSSPSARDLPPFEHRLPEALVWVGDTGLLIYRAAPPLLSTRGQRADHFAIVSRDFERVVSDLRARGVEVMVGPSQGIDGRTAMIDGPDQIAIEIVEGA
jgi:catechol 2,3-dioxygenase-like lactoylglutathione lyase family enzyme